MTSVVHPPSVVGMYSLSTHVQISTDLRRAFVNEVVPRLPSLLSFCFL